MSETIFNSKFSWKCFIVVCSNLDTDIEITTVITVHALVYSTLNSSKYSTWYPHQPIENYLM